MVTNNAINIGTGSSGQVLTSNGAGVAPTFQALPASGITGTVDQYEVVVGDAGNAVTSIGPGSAGQVLRSGGAAANPAYSTSTYPDTVASGSVLYATGTNAVGTLSPSTRYGANIGSDGSAPVYLDRNQYVYIYDDFITQVITSALGWGATQTNGNVTLNPNGVVPNTNPGIASINSGGPTGSFCKLRLGPNSVDAGPIKFGGGLISLQWIIGLSALSDGTDIYNLYVGFGSSVNSAEPEDGAYFWYTHSNNSGNWSFKTAASGSRTTGNSANAVTTAFTRLRIDVNAAASSVSFFVNDVECAGSPLAATIPTLTTNIECMIVKSGAGTTPRSVYCDLMTFYKKLTSSR